MCFVLLYHSVLKRIWEMVSAFLLFAIFSFINLGGLGHISIDAIEDGHHNGKYLILELLNIFYFNQKKAAMFSTSTSTTESTRCSIQKSIVNKKNFKNEFLLKKDLKGQKASCRKVFSSTRRNFRRTGIPKSLWNRSIRRCCSRNGNTYFRRNSNGS